MEGLLMMSAKERRREAELSRVVAGEQSLVEACERLGLSYRQGKRVFKRYRERGARGLVHRSRGRPSNRGKEPSFRRRVVARYRQRFAPVDMGPALAAEKLAHEGLAVDEETLRRWLMHEGLWRPRRKRSEHRTQRERRAHRGELVQMDGSHHRWFGSDGPQTCLMAMIDDATNTRLALMADEETTEACMRLLWQWVERYGVPRALYVDRKSVYVTQREPTLEEQLSGQEPLTAFGRACHKLGIEIIPANSPQAKGRIERSHGLYQDRFVKELRLRRIRTIAAANGLLNKGFTDQINTRFSREAALPQDRHRPLAPGVNLADVFCVEEMRVVQNDWTLRHDNRHYQILEDNRPLPKPKDKVLVRRRLDGQVHLLYRDQPLKFQTLTNQDLRARLKPEPAGPPPAGSPKPTPHTPRKTPWRQNCIYMLADTAKEKTPR
jgi:transposase